MGRESEDRRGGRGARGYGDRGSVADGVERARSKLEHSARATDFCRDTVTISELQQVYEAVWGVRLDPRNFDRKGQGVPGCSTPAGSERRPTKGRPARLFRAGPRTVLHPPLVRPDTSAAKGPTDD